MILFVYGLKSAWIPWLWPVWNQVFVFVFLAVWMRRSNAMTGAQWISFRFGEGRGAKLSYIIIVVFALVSVMGFMAYFFEGIGKFCTSILPYDLSFNIGTLKVANERSYALLICGITTIYTIKGGMYSVVATEVLQFILMTVSAFLVAYIGYTQVTAEQIAAVVPVGWDSLWSGWQLELDWSATPYPLVNEKIATDGFGWFGALLMMMIFKGIFASIAGPVPSYDMQRILSTRSPSDAAKMSISTILVMYIPRYLMVAGFAVMGLVYLQPEISAMGAHIDFEKVLPLAINKFVPIGFKGLLIAGLLAAFMGTFSAIINAAPAYIVNDIYKKYIRPDASAEVLIRYSVYSSLILVIIGIGFGFNAESLNRITLWITSALYGGYAAANMLKWVWWRFTGYGYFGGMIAGLLISTTILFFKPQLLNLFGWDQNLPEIFLFPLVLGISFIGCVVGTFIKPLENEAQVIRFYRDTQPWGWWGPIRKKLLEQEPDWKSTTSFKRDAFNVIVGMVWQMAQVLIPIYFMIKNNTQLAIWTVIFFVCSYLLKKFWWDRLKD